MYKIDQATFEMFAKDQGEKLRNIVDMCSIMNDSNWLTCREQIERAAKNGLAYLEHFNLDNPYAYYNEGLSEKFNH